MNFNNNKQGGSGGSCGSGGSGGLCVSGDGTGSLAKKSRTYIIPAGISAFGVLSAITLGTNLFDGSSNSSSNSSSHDSVFANEFLAATRDDLTLRICTFNLFVTNTLYDNIYKSPLKGKSALTHPIETNPDGTLKVEQSVEKEFRLQNLFRSHTNILVAVQEAVVDGQLLPRVLDSVGLRRIASGESHILNLPNSVGILNQKEGNKNPKLANEIYASEKIITLHTCEHRISSEKVTFHHRVFITAVVLIDDRIIFRIGNTHIGGGGKEDGYAIVIEGYYLEKIRQGCVIIDLGVKQNLNIITLDANFIPVRTGENETKRRGYYEHLCKQARDSKPDIDVQVITWEQWCEYDYGEGLIAYALSKGYTLLTDVNTPTSIHGVPIDWMFVKTSELSNYSSPEVIVRCPVTGIKYCGNDVQEDDISDHFPVATTATLVGNITKVDIERYGLVEYTHAPGRFFCAFPTTNFKNYDPRVDKP